MGRLYCYLWGGGSWFVLGLELDLSRSFDNGFDISYKGMLEIRVWIQLSFEIRQSVGNHLWGMFYFTRADEYVVGEEESLSGVLHLPRCLFVDIIVWAGDALS